MRIIAGALKGRRLSSPSWSGLRPTSDRLRETLFNILGDRVVDSSVLDACAGTIGFEALSRGAAQVTFIDRDMRATDMIQSHASRFEIADRCEVVCGRLPEALGHTRPGCYDVVVLDPPYDAPEIGDILSAVRTRLARDGILILEAGRQSPPPEVDGLECVRQVVSGRSSLNFYRSMTARDSSMPPGGDHHGK